MISSGGSLASVGETSLTEEDWGTADWSGGADETDDLSRGED